MRFVPNHRRKPLADLGDGIEHPGWSTAAGWTPQGQGEELLLQDSHSCGHRPILGWLTPAGTRAPIPASAWVGSARTLRLRSPPLPWAGSPRLAAQSGREPGTATSRGVPDAPFHLAGGARRGRRDSPSRTALVGAEAQLPRPRVEERRASRLAARPKEFRASTKVSTKVFSFDSFSVDQGHYRDCGTGATLENPGPVTGDAPAEFERNQSHPQDRQAGVGRPVARAGLILLPEFVAHPVAGSRSRPSSPECIVRRTSAGPGRRPLESRRWDPRLVHRAAWPPLPPSSPRR